MKAAGVVILFPLLSVLIVSLYVAGGAARTAALGLLAGSVLGIAVSLIRKRSAGQKLN
jgi:Na+/proline symporter